MENKNVALSIIGGLVVLVVILFIWKVVSVGSVEKEMKAQQASLVEQSQQLLTERTHHFLRMTTVPLVWAVRSEMIRNNYGQINEYVTSFVRERNIQQIVLVSADGVISVSTDKKIEGSPAASVYPAEMFEKQDIHIADDKQGNLIVTAPVMGLNARLGTLILIYKPEKLSIEAKA